MIPIHRTLIALLLVCATATVQRLDPAPPPAATPAPKPNARPDEAMITADICEPKLKGQDIANLYTKFTGRRVLVTSAAAAAEFAFIEEASPQNPLSYAQAAELLKKAAEIEYFAFIPSDQRPDLDILILHDSSPSRLGGPDIYNEGDPLPAAGEPIIYFMTFKHLKPEVAAKIFTKSLSKFATNSSVIALPNPPAVVITAETTVVRKLIDLKQHIDTRWYQTLSCFTP